MPSTKDPAADRHHGGPGSSHQRPDLPDPAAAHAKPAGPSTSTEQSRVSGGGGESDSHHTHNAKTK